MTKVLIIDDEEDLCEMYKMRLQTLGYEVECSYDGPRGLQDIDSFNPDVVLLDLIMPQMDGWEVCRKIRESRKELPVIIITAEQSKNMGDKIASVEANGLLLKPFDEKDLIKTINEKVPFYE